MSPLAIAIYRVLRTRLASETPSITYGELATKVEVHHRSSKLHAALGELTTACHAAKLPALPAIVWSASTHRPSDGYYLVAHPRVRSEANRQAAWEAEHERVVRAKDKYPAKL